MDALEIQHLSKSYRNNKAVDNISFSIQQGEFFGFLGQNGAGKTTTIHAVTGINTFDSGIIRVCGIDVVKDYKQARTKVGLSGQEFNVDIFQKVEKILWFMAGFYGMTKQARATRIEELLTIFELHEHKHKTFRELSGGLKRRVMIARAMVHDPELLILDEPTAGVDVELRHDMWKYLKKINSEGKTILLTSHYLEEVEYLCSRIAIIHKGKIIAVGDKDEFLKDGKNLEEKYLELTKNI